MVKKAKKVLIIKRRKRRRNEGKILPIKPELMKKPELNVLIYRNIGIMERRCKIDVSI